MAKRKQKPIDAEKIITYKKMRFFAHEFAKGTYNCLIVVGPPGRLKSSIFAECTAGNAHIISGNATPYAIYQELMVHKDELIIIDDADGLYRDSAGQRLLKQLLNPVPVKKVSWHSTANNLLGVDATFETTSKVCIIDNAWQGDNEHLAAIADRGRFLLFDPSASEVHSEVQIWFQDDEILKFIGENLCFFAEGISARLYGQALEAKTAGENWKEFVLKKVDAADKELILMYYEKDFKDLPVNEKQIEWSKRTGLGRSTYYARKEKLLERMQGHPLLGKWTIGL